MIQLHPRHQLALSAFLFLCLAALAAGRLLSAAGQERPLLVGLKLSGQVARPGVYLFPSPPRPSQLAALSIVDIASLEGRLPHGTWLVFKPGRLEQRRVSGREALLLGLPLDLNQASAQDLTLLEGLGPVLAARIVAWREERGPFERVEDLLAVPGLGPKVLSRIRPLLSTSPPGG